MEELKKINFFLKETLTDLCIIAYTFKGQSCFREHVKMADTFQGYFTIVLDIDKYHRWFNARKQNNPKLTHACIARRIRYGKSHLSKLLNQDKYNIEISARFIGTFLQVFGLDFEEIFSVIPVDQPSGVHPQERPYSHMNNFRRQDQKKMPHTIHSR